MPYVKLPVVVEAHQMTAVAKRAPATWPSWLRAGLDLGQHEPGAVYTFAGVMHVQSLEGAMVVSDGDYVIRGVTGELYPCKEAIFRATYVTTDQLRVSVATLMELMAPKHGTRVVPYR